jgi:uncharacterized protein
VIFKTTDGGVDYGESAAPTARHGGAAPVTVSERIASIDVVRGFSLFGILVINIMVFGLPTMNIFNPLIAGGFRGADFGFWWVSHMFFLQKFMTIFSLLFGAGIVLMCSRAESRGGSPRAPFYRRQLWLLAIGLLHAYLLWVGDILFSYAVSGMIVYLFRRRSPRFLIILGLIVIMVGVPMMYGGGVFFEKLKSEASDSKEAEARGEELLPKQGRMLARWEEMRETFDPAPGELRYVVEIYRDGYLGIVKHRAPQVLMGQTMRMLFLGLWRVAGLMLLGMGLMKIGIFSAVRSKRFYSYGMLAGYGIGLPVVARGAQLLIEHRFDFIYSFKCGQHYNYIGSLFVSFAHVCLVMLVCRSGILCGLTKRLAAVGRMALTNYLVHTVVFTTIFFGYGFGLFARFSRFHLTWFVLAMWLAQIIYSPIWLRRFRFGPAEWLWRSLTYRRAQPMRVKGEE